MYHLSPVANNDRYNCRDLDADTFELLTRKMKFAAEDVLRAVQEVGCDPEEIAEYIRDRYNRC